MRATLNREIVVRLRLDDEGGTLVAADSLPTLVVKDSLGNTIAGVSVVTSPSTGVYQATIPARSSVDTLTLSWAATVATFARTVTDAVTVTSERLVPLWLLREDAELAAVSTEIILRLSDTVEDWFRDALNFPTSVERYSRSWIQAFPVQRLRVPGVFFPISIVSLSCGRGTGAFVYDAPTLANIVAIESGFEFADTGVFAPIDFIRGAQRGTFSQGAYTAVVTHGGFSAFGFDRTPEHVRRAAAVLARYVSRTSNLPERARRVLSEHSEIDLSMPSAQYPTGLPEVDGVLSRYRLTAL